MYLSRGLGFPIYTWSWQSGWADKAQDSSHRYKVRRSDADQLFEGAQPERSMVVPIVLEFPTVLCTWDMEK